MLVFVLVVFSYVFHKNFITCFRRIRVFFSRSFLANKMKGTNVSIFLYLFNAIKIFRPQAWSYLFAFSVFFKFCCISQSLIVSFKRPGLANQIENTPFIRSGHLESILYRPQLQCLIAPFLFISFCFLHSFYPFSSVSPLHLKFYTSLFVRISIPACNCSVS